MFLLPLIIGGGLLLLSVILYSIFKSKQTSVVTATTPIAGKNTITFDSNSNIDYSSVNNIEKTYILGTFNTTVFLTGLKFSYDLNTSIIDTSKIQIVIQDNLKNILLKVFITKFNMVPLVMDINNLQVFKDCEVSMILNGSNIKIFKPIISFTYSYTPQQTTPQSTYIQTTPQTTYIQTAPQTTYIQTTTMPPETTPVFLPIEYSLYAYSGSPVIIDNNNIILKSNTDVVFSDISENNYDYSLYMEFTVPIITNDNDVITAGFFNTDPGIDNTLYFLKNKVGDVFLNEYVMDTSVENKIRIYSYYNKYIYYINDTRHEIKSQLLSEKITANLNFYIIFQIFQASSNNLNYNIKNIQFYKFK